MSGLTIRQLLGRQPHTGRSSCAFFSSRCLWRVACWRMQNWTLDISAKKQLTVEWNFWFLGLSAAEGTGLAARLFLCRCHHIGGVTRTMTFVVVVQIDWYSVLLLCSSFIASPSYLTGIDSCKCALLLSTLSSVEDAETRCGWSGLWATTIQARQAKECIAYRIK